MQHLRKVSGFGLLSSQQNVLSDLSTKEKIYSGYLFKKASNRKKFQKRYFALYEGQLLVYYSSDVAKHHKGEIKLCNVIAIHESNVAINDQDIYQKAFEMETKHRSYLFTAPDTISMNSWIDHIKRSVFGTTIHEGWLTKKGKNVKSWRRRYFVLTDTKLLRYFEDKEQTKIKGIINVQRIKSIREGEAVEPHWHFMIELQTSDRLWFLNADSAAKREVWLRMLDEGKKVINYDADSHLFTDMDRESDIPKDVMFSQTTERIQYILRLYEKWCKGNQQFHDDEEKSPAKPSLSNQVSFGFKAEDGNKSKGIWEILNHDLRDYSSIELLNDSDFLLSNYGSHSQRLKFAEFYRFVLGNNAEKPAVPASESLILLRNCRDRAYYSKHGAERRILYNDNEDVKEINAQILLDRFYSFVMYSYDTLILDPVQWARIKDYDETDKFMTADVMLKEKKQWRRKVDSDHYKIADRASKFNTDELTTPQLKVDEETNGAYFQFGTQDMMYWDDCKEDEWFIPKLYENLKEEMVSNTLCIVSMEQWDDCMQSASNISETKKASQYLSYDGLQSGDDANADAGGDMEAMVDKYGIYEFTPIKLNHICSLVLYSNYYSLQQALIATYASQKEESVEAWKLRHSQFAIWSRYLKECCCVFGRRFTDKDVFYYSINTDDIDFAASLNTSYVFPTSMTRNVFIAQSYLEDQLQTGMLLSVTQHTNSLALWMDCGWCSEFPSEQEALVLSVYPQQSRIHSMIHISYDAVRNERVFNNYQHYMSAMSDLERMIHAQNASNAIHHKQSKMALNEMIRYRLGDAMDAKESKNEDDDNDEKEVRLTSAHTPGLTMTITSTKAIDTEDAVAHASYEDPFHKQPLAPLEDSDDNDETEGKEAPQSPPEQSLSKKVRPKGRKGSESSRKEVHDIVFTLKAKRKRRIPEHIKAMFDAYCDSVRHVSISLRKMVNEYRGWKEIFMNVEHTWCKLDLLIRLFPNLETIEMEYTAQTFTKQSVKELVSCLKSKWVQGRELNLKILKPNEYKEMSQESVECYSLESALKKYLLKKSKTGDNFCWICRLNEEEEAPCIEIMRPNNAMGRNKALSTILSEDQVNLVMAALKKELSKNGEMSNKWYLNPLFCTVKQGFDAGEFHQICDGIGPTLSIIQSSNDGYVFGAYTSKPWGRTGKWVMDEYACLIQIQKENANIINIKAGHEQYGMYLQSHGGPGFGKGDIKILNKANKTTRNTCHSNSFVFKTKPNELVGGKGAYFKVKHYEVFQIAFY